MTFDCAWDLAGTEEFWGTEAMVRIDGVEIFGKAPGFCGEIIGKIESRKV